MAWIWVTRWVILVLATDTPDIEQEDARLLGQLCLRPHVIEGDQVRDTSFARERHRNLGGEQIDGTGLHRNERQVGRLDHFLNDGQKGRRTVEDDNVLAVERGSFYGIVGRGGAFEQAWAVGLRGTAALPPGHQ
jgi:hypothetical protein